MGHNEPTELNPYPTEGMSDHMDLRLVEEIPNHMHASPSKPRNKLQKGLKPSPSKHKLTTTEKNSPSPCVKPSRTWKW